MEVEDENRFLVELPPKGSTIPDSLLSMNPRLAYLEDEAGAIIIRSREVLSASLNELPINLNSDQEP
jgi:hypothetical protein